MNPKIQQIAQAVLAGHQLDQPQAHLLASLTGHHLYDLFYWANRIRITCAGPAVSFCSIAPLTLGGCTEDCAFCAQSARYHTPLTSPATLSDDQVLAAADQARHAGAQCFGLVTAGRCPSKQLFDRLLDLIAKLRRRLPIGLCASAGSLDHTQAHALRQAGLHRYNHNLETSAAFFPRVITSHHYHDRLATLAALQQAQLPLCSGGIFGLGETWPDRIDLAFALRPFAPQSIPLNFLHPIPGTPLARAAPLPPMEILHIIALFRFIFPATQIKVAGGRETNLRDLQSWIFFAGADSALIGNYLSTTGRPPDQDRQMIADLALDSPPDP